MTVYCDSVYVVTLEKANLWGTKLVDGFLGVVVE